MPDKQKAEILLEAKNKMAHGVRGAQAELNKLKKSSRGIGTSFKQMSQVAKKALHAIKIAAIAVAVAITGIAIAVKKFISTASQFQQFKIQYMHLMIKEHTMLNLL